MNQPNQQRTLKKLPPELRRRNFDTKRRLSITSRCRTCEKCVCNVRIVPTELPFLHTTVAGWGRGRRQKKNLFWGKGGFLPKFRRNVTTATSNSRVRKGRVARREQSYNVNKGVKKKKKKKKKSQKPRSIISCSVY